MVAEVSFVAAARWTQYLAIEMQYMWRSISWTTSTWGRVLLSHTYPMYDSSPSFSKLGEKGNPGSCSRMDHT